jgi:hypothetical protein
MKLKGVMKVKIRLYELRRDQVMAQNCENSNELNVCASPGRLYLRRWGVPRAYTLGPERW